MIAAITLGASASGSADGTNSAGRRYAVPRSKTTRFVERGAEGLATWEFFEIG